MKKRFSALALCAALTVGLLGGAPAQASTGDCTMSGTKATCTGANQEALRGNSHITSLELDNAPIQGDVLGTMNELTELQYVGGLDVNLQETLEAPSLTKVGAYFRTKETKVKNGSTFTLPTFKFLDGQPFEFTFEDDLKGWGDNPPAKKVGFNTFKALRPIYVTVFNRNFWDTFYVGGRQIDWDIDLGDMWMLHSYDYLSWNGTGAFNVFYTPTGESSVVKPSATTVPAGTSVTVSGTLSPAGSYDRTECTWLRDGKVVEKAAAEWKTGCQYQLTKADSGKKLIVRAQHKPDSGWAESVFSTTDTLSRTFTVQEPVKFKVGNLGNVAVGKKVTAKVSGAPTGTKIKYQWRRNGQTIKGATQSSYTPVAADLHQRISVLVSGSKPGYFGLSFESNYSDKIVKGKFSVTKAPSISGKTVFGQTLKVNPGTRSAKPGKFTYQWLRDGKNIKGATKTSHKLGLADIGKKISVKVTASGTGFHSQTSTAAKNQLISKAKFVVEKSPTVSGKVKVGGKLTAKPGTWSPKPDKYSYQWYRSGAPISKATKSTYKVTGRDRGKVLYVKVTASKKGYISKTATSKVK